MKQTTKWLAAALIALGLNQAVWADNIPDFRETLQAAKQGNAKAQVNLGLMYEQGQGVRQDYTQAAQWYRKAAEQGDAKAQFNLGVMYENRQGVRQDYKQAVQWYRKAAEQGDAQAQFNLGGMYAQGRGVRQDYAQAVQWYRKACQNGHQDGCHNYQLLKAVH